MATQNLTLTNSRLTRAPADFTIPSMSLRCAWEHWCCGDPSGRIGPYRFLQWQDLSTCGKRKTLSAYRDVTPKNRQRRKGQLKWSTALNEIREIAVDRAKTRRLASKHQHTCI
ncbi:hypothetical protein PHYSODRAFT_503532 [Phytophthora sojae]|uniref:Uncharacterized protein n=1 Tax=Phytophthora sojae (strain P6497) TaxID=1094619 RepID=G4ZEH9_PHYSP|nr:hypothetical protein PHYSODRAFT_503532 [Phytophthora sojae]EGZ18444.1 hypothetical protein PHYSODRAFT_503532 [Phytophthora sojae]|eukprot:XP_009527502.1 hypothetical protein PHYSODRAFT_503532 [Phytophthora sojae]